MSSFFSNLFETELFMPHGYCFLWQAEIVWMHIIGDVAIALAYFAIPITIAIILKRRQRETPFRWVFTMFAIFIVCCGLTHVISLITLWYPIYYLEGVMKVITAAASVATAVMILPLIPLLVETFEQAGLDRE